MFIDPVGPDEAEGLTKEIYDAERERWGFLPGFVTAFSPHPEVYQAWTRLVGTLYEGMDRRRCELATLAAARVYRSTCCAVAHGKVLRDRFFTSEDVVKIVTDHHHVDLEPVDVAIIDFAEKVATDASSITQADVDHLRSLGLNDRDVFDVVYAVAARAFFTTMVEALGTATEPEFLEALEPELVEALSVGRPPE